MAKKRVATVAARKPVKGQGVSSAPSRKKISTKRKPQSPRTSPGDSFAGISSDAVEKATGKPWAHWLAVLDDAGAKTLPHQEIAGLLHSAHKVRAWWAQMVTVGYEQARGLRVKHQTATGFSANASRTIRASMSVTFKAWTDDRLRTKWLPDAPMTIRKATPCKSIRIAWTHPPARNGGEPRIGTVEVYLLNRSDPGAPRTVVQVQENKLPKLGDVKKCKAFWAAALDRLRVLLETV